MAFHFEGIRKTQVKKCTAPLQVLPWKQDITRTGNIYTLTFEKFLIFRNGIKSCFLFYVLSAIPNYSVTNVA